MPTAGLGYGRPVCDVMDGERSLSGGEEPTRSANEGTAERAGPLRCRGRASAAARWSRGMILA